MKTAQDYFNERFGTGYDKVTLTAEHKERFVRKDDIIELMESYKKEALEEASEKKDKHYFKEISKECFDAMMKANPSGGIKEFIRMAVEFGYKKSQESILSLISKTHSKY